LPGMSRTVGELGIDAATGGTELGKGGGVERLWLLAIPAELRFTSKGGELATRRDGGMGGGSIEITNASGMGSGMPSASLAAVLLGY
jgi:hypothetical protein